MGNEGQFVILPLAIVHDNRVDACMGRITMIRYWTLFIVVLLSACTATNRVADVPGVTFIEQVEQRKGELIIPYSKYRLDNGLTVIIHEDKSDPLVRVDVTYHVGSAREEPRRSGFAHFFEHMMFQGSQHVADEEHIKTVTEVGGDMNGTTNNDRTNYFETVPNNNLETMLWLESDRMGFLLEAVTQEKFEVQRATVKNERGQNVENRPYGRYNEVNAAALYPPGHPYSWPVIGYPEDLDAATVDDLKRFFLRWYGPNNATLTVGGDVDKREVLQLAVKYFGPIPAGPAVTYDHRDPVALTEDRYVSYVDDNIRFPALFLTFPTVPYNHPDRIALECLTDIIGNGKKSLFYKQFVLTRKAIEANAFNNTMELAGSVTFYVLPFPGVSLSQFETEMRDLLANFDESSISDDDMQIYKAGQESALVRSLASVSGKVSQLAYYQTFLQDPNQVEKELEGVRKLTKQDVMRVFNQYIKDKPAIIESVIAPNMPDGQAKPDNFTVPPRLQRTASATAALTLRPVPETFDRSVKPTPGKAPLVPVPAFWRSHLANGVEVIGVKSSEIPLITLDLNFDGGQLLEDPAQFGLASLTTEMMNESTQQLSAEQFEIELQKLGSRVSVSSGAETTRVSLSSLTDRFDDTLVLLEQRLFEDKLTEDDFNRLKKQQLEAIEANKQQPSSIASDVYRKLLYGEGHNFSVSGIGNTDTVEKITYGDVTRFANSLFGANNLQVVVVGDIDQDEAMEKLAFLNRLPATSATVRSQPTPPKTIENILYFVDKPGAEQSEIRIGYMTDLPYDATGEFFSRYLMNFVLGGAFNSRINLNLREDKGYTYGARSGFSGSKLPGPFTASASVKKESTADSVRQFVNEITNYRDNGITSEELEFMRSAIGQSDALNYETPRQKAGFLNRIIRYNLPENFVDQQTTIINTITQEQINHLAKKYLPIEKMLILVVGDKSVVGQTLKELGYKIIELDSAGRPVG